MTGYEAYEALTEKLNAAFASMKLDVRAHITTSLVRLLSDDRDQLALAAAFTLDCAQKSFPNASIGDVYEGRRSGWICEIAFA